MSRDDTDEVRISSITEQKMQLVQAVGARLGRLARARAMAENRPDDTLIIPAPSSAGSGPVKGSPDHYLILPAGAEAPGDPAFPYWRIELHTAGPYDIALGMDVYGDVLLGRGSEEAQRPDVDLELYRALEFGVSRRHAILRPTRQALYLLDLGSTNGTRVNSMTLGSSQAYPLQHNDVFSLGNMVFLVKIIHRPERTAGGDDQVFSRIKI